MLDTKKLRANVEAVRDASEQSAHARALVKALIRSGTSGVSLKSALNDARYADERLRGARNRLYADASPEALILSLLDMAEGDAAAAMEGAHG